MNCLPEDSLLGPESILSFLLLSKKCNASKGLQPAAFGNQMWGFLEIQIHSSMYWDLGKDSLDWV